VNRSRRIASTATAAAALALGAAGTIVLGPLGPPPVAEPVVDPAAVTAEAPVDATALDADLVRLTGEVTSLRTDLDRARADAAAARTSPAPPAAPAGGQAVAPAPRRAPAVHSVTGASGARSGHGEDKEGERDDD
jgi:hypothetical protein